MGTLGLPLNNQLTGNEGTGMNWLTSYIEVFWDSSFTVSNVMEGWLPQGLGSDSLSQR